MHCINYSSACQELTYEDFGSTKIPKKEIPYNFERMS